MGYLVWVVIPMLIPASISLSQSFTTTTEGTLHVSTDDRFEIFSLIRDDGSIEFRSTEEFALLDRIQLIPEGIDVVKPLYPLPDAFVAQTRTGMLVFFSISHDVRYFQNQRVVENNVESLFKGSSIPVPTGVDFDVYRSDNRLRVAVLQQNGEIFVEEYRDVDDHFELEEARSNTINAWGREATNLDIILGPRGRWIFEVDRSNGDYRLINVASIRRITIEEESVFETGSGSFQFVEPILGRYSFLVADDQGSLDHWILGPVSTGQGLTRVRSFQYPSPITTVTTELRRKGFFAIDQSGRGHLGYTTSSAERLADTTIGSTPNVVVFAPRADHLVALHDDSVDIFKVSNKHPEVSWSTLWGRVAYEGYEEPVHSWQSSSADTEFEPKFSLMPLLFGTIKAAFYAMLFATPLAIAGAIYTAVFMSENMRKLIKPVVEIMAALPTVILGFIAGLWLAPIVEKHLTSILLLFIIPPLGVLLFAYLTTLLPQRITARFEGWFGAITIPIIVLLVWVTIANDEFFSALIFQGYGDAKTWFYEVAGIDYDQRNALIIGIAMGLAVIPTIFSISEDAIYGVPQHLVHGSLALGATRWQTLVRVVLLTASPGIFSAVMIGMGRAVGETMIVLMATGNTPIMDVNLFEGMRTFAANIAVEMPESEVGSTHFRILFLTAFVLFLITFLFNTVAEVVRQRLRTRYGNL